MAPRFGAGAIARAAEVYPVRTGLYRRFLCGTLPRSEELSEEPMQVMHAIISGAPRQRLLPEATDQVLPGVVWGAFDELLTPAFWLGQAWQHEALGTFSDLRLGRSLVEELAACLLGGFGMPAELGLAAYRRLR